MTRTWWGVGRSGLALALQLALVVAGGSLAACQREPRGLPPSQHVEGGNPRDGVVALQSYGCDACHIVPGIRTYEATVGPPLDYWGDRVYIAGRLVNNTGNLIRWIQTPQAVDPQNAMPDMAVRAQDARDMAAYLYTLRHPRQQVPMDAHGQ
jgi:cytochrome c